MRTVGTAIIGAGLWGTNHALALTTYPRAAVRIVCDRDEGRACTLGDIGERSDGHGLTPWGDCCEKLDSG